MCQSVRMCVSVCVCVCVCAQPDKPLIWNRCNWLCVVVNPRFIGFWWHLTMTFNAEICFSTLAWPDTPVWEIWSRHTPKCSQLQGWVHISQIGGVRLIMETVGKCFRTKIDGCTHVCAAMQHSLINYVYAFIGYYLPKAYFFRLSMRESVCACMRAWCTKSS